MAKREKAKKVFKPEVRVWKEPAKPKVKKVSKPRSILYSFPNIKGKRIAVMARSMKEAVVKAKEEVNKFV